MNPRPTSSRPRSAVVYVRISKDRTNETSTESQTEACRRYCEYAGIEVVDVIVEAGRSAFKADRKSRPGMRRAMQIVAAGAATELVVWKLNRACRNSGDTLQLVDELRGHGAQFHSVTEQFDTSTATGKLILVVLAALAEMESAIKSEQASAWHESRRRVEDGNGETIVPLPPVGRPLCGYLRPAKNVLAVDPERGPLMADAFDRVRDGASMRSTVAWLATVGVTITQRGLMKVLTSPTIAGVVDVGGGVFVAGEWPALVDFEDWQALRVVLLDPKRRTNHSAGERRHPLAGVVGCYCGSAMRSKHHPRGMRLTCTTCTNSMVYDAVERHVDNELLALLDDDAWSALRAQGRGRNVVADDYDRRKRDLMALVVAGTLDVADFATMKAELDGALALSTAPLLILPTVDSLRDAWSDLDVKARRMVYDAVVETAVIGPATPGAQAADLRRVELNFVA